MALCSSFVCDYPFFCSRFYPDPVSLGSVDHGLDCCEECVLFSCDYCVEYHRCESEGGVDL